MLNYNSIIHIKWILSNNYTNLAFLQMIMQNMIGTLCKRLSHTGIKESGFDLKMIFNLCASLYFDLL
jgi:hypothetical protein